MPVEAPYADYASLEGEVVFKLFRASGACCYVPVPLDTELLASIHAPDPSGAFSLYRDARGRITPVARYLALACLERRVPIRAISQQLGLSESTLRRWWRERRRVAGMACGTDVPDLLRTLAFRRNAEG